MPLNLSGKITLLETAAINKLSLMLLVVDTAVMHIATANDIPTFAFFGPTAVNNWGPWDKTKMKSDYRRGGGLQIHGKHRVLMEDKSCLPCSNLGCDNSGISNCLNSLSLDVIKEQIRLVVNGKKIRVLHTEWSDGWGGQEIRIINEMVAMRELGVKVF